MLRSVKRKLPPLLWPAQWKYPAPLSWIFFCSWRYNSSYKLNTLDTFCLWQCFNTNYKVIKVPQKANTNLWNLKFTFSLEHLHFLSFTYWSPHAIVFILDIKIWFSSGRRAGQDVQGLQCWLSARRHVQNVSEDRIPTLLICLHSTFVICTQIWSHRGGRFRT